MGVMVLEPAGKDILSPPSPPSPSFHRASLHVVFSAECIPAFDWQSCGLFYSFHRVKQPGRITRLLACSAEQLKSYPRVNLEMGPTFVHENMRFDHEFNDDEMNDEFHDQKGRGYASYNKPYSVHAWLEKVDVRETYILMMDTDMLLRAPVDPVALGVRRGNVVSAEYTYLYGTQSGFAKRFVDESLHHRFAQVGGFHIFHREDLRQIAPKWLRFTRRVREFANANPEAFFNESFKEEPNQKSDVVNVHHKQARWHTEMYGYVFAAAEVGVTHRIRRDVMLYPSYAPYLGRPPLIMHYGSDYTLGKTYFNKMAHQQLMLETCPGFLFADTGLNNLDQLSKKDALTFEHITIMNAAFCEFYARHANCSHLPKECGERETAKGSTYLRQLDEIVPALKRCSDDHEGCTGWAAQGECQRNPLFMHSSCPVSCKSCDKPLDELVKDDADRGNWRKPSESERQAQHKILVAFVDSAKKEDLDDVEEMIKNRRAELEAEAEEEEESELHQEL